MRIQLAAPPTTSTSSPALDHTIVARDSARSVSSRSGAPPPPAPPVRALRFRVPDRPQAGDGGHLTVLLAGDRDPRLGERLLGVRRDGAPGARRERPGRPPGRRARPGGG